MRPVAKIGLHNIQEEKYLRLDMKPFFKKNSSFVTYKAWKVAHFRLEKERLGQKVALFFFIGPSWRTQRALSSSVAPAQKYSGELSVSWASE